ncbi:SPOR domain-containing protein [Malikia sp.]|uniref:SPOR domain-containing protein n=1 Tax=Malikia sp. TaxID=2070706 RepID=UPI00261508F9|nr:SPOR domain-containing protein [Malikia sp.]MDD2729031.1 SPOR domain-containing protein [Malikia sp.]
MFKFRFGGQGSSSPMQPSTIETVRRRARHRLLGASVLVLAGVIGFPLLFESQPRPVPVDFEIDIPARNAAKSKTAAQDAASQPGARLDGLDESEELVRSAQAPAQAAPAPVTVTSPPPPVPVVAPAAPVAQAVAPAQPQTVPKPWEKIPVVVDKPAETKPAVDRKPAEPKPEPKPADKPAERKPVEPKVAPKAPDDAARAMALLEGKSAPQDKPAGEDKSAAKRHVVQVGAFVDPTLAQEARMKLERGGLTTYTQIGNTPDGPRTRVRLGPFATRDEAAKAAAKARALGLSASILTL